MVVVDQLLEVFARSIYSKVEVLKSLTLTKNQRDRLRGTVVADIRACGGILYPLPVEASEAAIREAVRLDVKLFEHSWKSQSRFDKGRKLFHWEHVETIGEIRRACENAANVNEVLDILKSRLRIAWILKHEDRELTKLGFKTIRPDANDAYTKAKIVLVKSPSSE